MTQTTLTGEEADLRARPSTMLWCDETEQWVLRSNRYDWPHELYESPHDVLEEETIHTSVTIEEDDDEPEEVGGMFDITLSYNVDYSFRIPAVSEHQAKERAEELVGDCDSYYQHHVHTDKRKLKTLYEDSDIIPDDWDPYGQTPLWLAIEEAEEK